MYFLLKGCSCAFSQEARRSKSLSDLHHAHETCRGTEVQNWTIVPTLAVLLACMTTLWIHLTRIGAQLIGELTEADSAPTYRAVRSLSKARCPAFDLHLHPTDSPTGPLLRYRPQGCTNRKASVLLLTLWDAVMEAARAAGAASFFDGELDCCCACMAV